MAVSFKVNNIDIPPLINFAISKPVFSVFASIPFTTTSSFFKMMLVLFHLNLSLMLLINIFLGLPGKGSPPNFASKIN